jgi:hypothetical protein
MRKTGMTSFENRQVVLGIVQAALLLATFLGALYVGLKQNEINDRLRILQDYVAVSAVPGPSGTIKLINAGKMNIYLWGFDMPGNNPRFQKPRLIPAGTMESAWYWINPPVPPDSTKGKYKFDFKLYLSDEYNNKWVSEHGGEVERTALKEKGKQTAIYELTMWSYKTYRFEWSLGQ